MLLTIDVGNTQTVIGLFAKRRLEGDWRLSTRRELTSDEKALEISGILGFSGHRLSEITGVCLASVVPAATGAFTAMFAQYTKAELLTVGAKTKTGLKINYLPPESVGADRLANAAGGFDTHGGPLIIVDFGTATTFDVISEDGTYLGGAIAPGVEIGAAALFRAAARLSGVALEAPPGYIGKNSDDSLKSGLVFGAAAMVEGMVAGIKKERAGEMRVAATGGLAELIAPFCPSIESVEPLLTIIGLRKIWELNR